MRSKKVVPVGKGCREVTLAPGITQCQCHAGLHVHRCMGCGDRFHSAAPHTKTCSDRCRKRLSRMRHDKMFQMVLTYAGGGD